MRVDAVAVEIRHEVRRTPSRWRTGTTILDVALDAGIDLRYDCKMGVCICARRRLSRVRSIQSGSMVSEDVAEAGYRVALLRKPESLGVVIQTVSEDELLDAQFGA